MRIPYRPYLTLLFAIASATAPHVAAPAGQEPAAHSALPPDVQALVSRAAANLAHHDFATVQALGDRPERFAWLKDRARVARVGWQVAAIRLPAAIPSSTLPDTGGRGAARNHQPSTVYLATFYAYHTCESIGDHFHTLVSTAAGWRFGAEIPETETLGYRVRDHDLNVRIDPPRHAVHVTDDVAIERTSASPGGLCLLRLCSLMRVSRVEVGGNAISSETMPYADAPGVVALIPPNRRRSTIRLEYDGSYRPTRGVDNYVGPAETVLNAYWWPHIARLPAATTITATVPSGWIADAAGEPQDVQRPATGVAFRWRNTVPTCFFTLDGGPYTVTSRTVDSRKLSAYQLRPNADRANAALDRLAAALAFFEHSFGPMPYTHYEMVQTLGPFGGAMEGYSLATFQGDFGANAHELSHTWWGGIVPNTYLHSEWNESFANYSDALFQRMTAATRPATALRGQHAAPDFGRHAAGAFAVPMATAFDTDSQANNAVGYGKGAMVLEMLEDLLGTETMLRCARHFRDNTRPGDAPEWPDFARAVREVTGRDYGWFFAQWVDRGGLPQVKLADVRAQRHADGWLVSGAIEQSGTPYRLRLPVSVTTDGGADAATTIEASSPRTAFTLTTPAAPTELRLDPDGTVLMAGAPTPADVDPFKHHF